MNTLTHLSPTTRNRILSALLILGGIFILLASGQLFAPSANGAQILGSLAMIAGATGFVAATEPQQERP